MTRKRINIAFWSLWACGAVGVALMCIVFTRVLDDKLPDSVLSTFLGIASLILGPISLLGSIFLLGADKDCVITRGWKIALILFSLLAFCMSTGVVVVVTLIIVGPGMT